MRDYMFETYAITLLSQSDIPDKVRTAIGEIPTDLNSFIGTIAAIGIGLGGVAAVGLLSVGAFTLLTSTGEPEKLANGREMITNALMGLALVVLALLVYEFIWDILGLSSVTGIPFGNW